MLGRIQCRVGGNPRICSGNLSENEGSNFRLPAPIYMCVGMNIVIEIREWRPCKLKKSENNFGEMGCHFSRITCFIVRRSKVRTVAFIVANTRRTEPLLRLPRSSIKYRGAQCSGPRLSSLKARQKRSMRTKCQGCRQA